MKENENTTKSSFPNDLSSSENEIILYQPDSTLTLDVRLENETVYSKKVNCKRVQLARNPY